MTNLHYRSMTVHTLEQEGSYSPISSCARTPLISDSMFGSQQFRRFKVLAASLSTSVKRPIQFYKSATEAIHDIEHGAKILIGGYGMCGIPENLIDALVQKKTSGLICVSSNGGIAEFGPGLLMKQKQMKRFITSHVGFNEELIRQFLSGDLEAELLPQGNLMERLRAGGAGIPAFFTPTGYGTLAHKGGIPIKYNADGSVALQSKPRESREFDGVNYIMERAITGDFALVKAWKADRAGNLIFRKTARNTNPLMCKAGRITIAEVEEIVETGAIPAEDVHVPHIYIQRVIKGQSYQKPLFSEEVKRRLVKKDNSSTDQDKTNTILKRAALELKNGMYVNLGVGLPTLVSNHVRPGINVHFHGDNGFLGMGRAATKDDADPDLSDAGGNAITTIDGSSYFDIDEALTMVRGGYLDVSILGGMEVSQYGDLANWIVPGKILKGMGGAMDLVALEKTNVIVTMEHTAKNGKPRILKECTIPLTGKRCVNMVITEMGVFEISKNAGLVMTEIADGFSVEDVKNATGCELQVSPDLKPMQTL